LLARWHGSSCHERLWLWLWLVAKRHWGLHWLLLLKLLLLHVELLLLLLSHWLLLLSHWLLLLLLLLHWLE
jgi:hypothetical protein